MEKLMQAIRQKTCRHRFVDCASWIHKSAIQTWSLTGTCANCGRRVFDLSMPDESVENMYKDMQKEKRGDAGRA